MSTLILKHANTSRPGAIDWGPNDYDVFEGERCVGRIFVSPAAPSDRNWMWTIIAREHPPTIYNREYSVTREEAIADFKAQWQPP